MYLTSLRALGFPERRSRAIHGSKSAKMCHPAYAVRTGSVHTLPTEDDKRTLVLGTKLYQRSRVANGPCATRPSTTPPKVHPLKFTGATTSEAEAPGRDERRCEAQR